MANPNVDPTTPLSERTAGFLVFEYDIERILLENNETGKGLYEFFQLVFGYMYKELLRVSQGSIPWCWIWMGMGWS